MASVTQHRVRGRPARKSHSCSFFTPIRVLMVPDPSGPTVLTYTPNGEKLITAGTNNVVRVYATGSDGEPTNLDDCQENNTAIAATVCGNRSPLRSRLTVDRRTNSSSPGPKMGQSVCIRSIPTPTRKCSRGAPYPFAISHSLRTGNGRLCRASKCRLKTSKSTV